MRNYSLTPIRNQNTWISWSKQYLHPLAGDIKSLYDYWLYFSPNFEEISYVNYFVNGEEILGLKSISDQQYQGDDTNNKLIINALNYRQYVYIRENNIKAAFGNDIDLPAGCLVMSNVMPIGINSHDNEERQKIENYIIQYSSSADYYLYSIVRDNISNNYSLVATYTPNAGEIYGNQITLQIPSYFPRFYMSPKAWQIGTSGMTFAAFNKNNDIITNQIVDKKGLVWQTFFEISPYIYLQENDIALSPNNASISYVKKEEVILDASYNIYLNKVDNVAIPSYNITMNDNQKITIRNEKLQVVIY